MANKRKIINDPVYGFITIRHDFILDIIDHSWFQRLRRIAQLGLSHLVYPGATHNRFQHAIGAMNLMQGAVDEIRHKGHAITDEEEQGLLAAVLLHDIGHGPFSHALEHTLVSDLQHEDISSIMMKKLNDEMNGSLSFAIKIFNNDYPKKFLHQLVSSQLDMDRLDYLARDSFFSGVVEGQVGSERILKMLDVVEDQLVVEEKGIYSIEKFIVARRFMYWQVYLHHAVLSAEFMLVNVLKRAKELASNGEKLFCSPALEFFLYHNVKKEDFLKDSIALEHYSNLDDFDIMGAMKVWQTCSDKVLSLLSRKLVNRELFKIEIQREPFSVHVVESRIESVATQLSISKEEAAHFVIHEKVDNRAYNQLSDSIRIKMKDGRVRDASGVSDHLNLAALNKKVEKWFLAWPK
ncbi:MAG: HD domain-containing protein [Flavobacteriales bacterium]|nr:HD domain-containing protein [Flavobacteriales bacterium]